MEYIHLAGQSSNSSSSSASHSERRPRDGMHARSGSSAYESPTTAVPSTELAGDGGNRRTRSRTTGQEHGGGKAPRSRGKGTRHLAITSTGSLPVPRQDCWPAGIDTMEQSAGDEQDRRDREVYEPFRKRSQRPLETHYSPREMTSLASSGPQGRPGAWTETEKGHKGVSHPPSRATAYYTFPHHNRSATTACPAQMSSPDGMDHAGEREAESLVESPQSGEDSFASNYLQETSKMMAEQTAIYHKNQEYEQDETHPGQSPSRARTNHHGSAYGPVQGKTHVEPSHRDAMKRRVTLSPEQPRQDTGDHNAGSFRQWTFEEQFRQLYSVDANPERKEFLDSLFEYMHKKGKPISRIPIMAKQTLDLFKLYTEVVDRGGLVEVINRKLWREVAKALQIPATITSSAFTLRVQYIKYLYPYECEMLQLSNADDLAAAIDGNKRDIIRLTPVSPTTSHRTLSGAPLMAPCQQPPVHAASEPPPPGHGTMPFQLISITPSLAAMSPLGAHHVSTPSVADLPMAHAVTPAGVPVFFATSPPSVPTVPVASHRSPRGLPPGAVLVQAAPSPPPLAAQQRHHSAGLKVPSTLQQQSPPLQQATSQQLQQQKPPPQPSYHYSQQPQEATVGSPPMAIVDKKPSASQPVPVVSIQSDPSQACNINLQRATLLHQTPHQELVPGHDGHYSPVTTGGSASQCLIASVVLDGVRYEGTLLPKQAGGVSTPSSATTVA